MNLQQLNPIFKNGIVEAIQLHTAAATLPPSHVIELAHLSRELTSCITRVKMEGVPEEALLEYASPLNDLCNEIFLGHVPTEIAGCMLLVTEVMVMSTLSVVFEALSNSNEAFSKVEAEGILNALRVEMTSAVTVQLSDVAHADANQNMPAVLQVLKRIKVRDLPPHVRVEVQKCIDGQLDDLTKRIDVKMSFVQQWVDSCS